MKRVCENGEGWRLGFVAGNSICSHKGEILPFMVSGLGGGGMLVAVMARED